MHSIQTLSTPLSRAQGCLLGQFAGDSLAGWSSFNGQRRFASVTQMGLRNSQMAERGATSPGNSPTTARWH